MNSLTDKYHVLLDKFFNNEASEDEIESLANWMKYEDIPEAFDLHCKQRWSTSSDTVDRRTAQEMWDIISAKAGAGKKRFRIHPVLYRIASLVLLPVCICMGMYVSVLSKAEKDRCADTFEVLADKGQKASVILPDGTKAWINSGTRLSYNCNGNGRNVELDGEAYFEVAKDAERKFTVSCHDLRVEALGTVFNVKGYYADETVSVALLEGKVKVFNTTNSAILSPDQSLSFNRRDNSFLRTEIKDSREVDFWRRNILYFRSATLAEIAKTLERMYGVTVDFKDEELRNVPFSGSIRNSSLNNVFHIISLTYPITYEIKNDVITIKKGPATEK